MKKGLFFFLLSMFFSWSCFADNQENGNSLENTIVYSSSDYKRAGKSITDQILQSGVLENVSEKKYNLMFGRIINESFYNFDVDAFVKNIRSSLKSKVNIVKGNKKDIDFVLAGRLTERTATLLNKTKRKEYYIELKLTDFQTNTELKVIKIPFVHKN
ncbi:MAG: penicillin-binding protein activator LpoB [Alphaproteobacteria bacterium]|nr:penicillin-binding protein activator LpoB [Alphaproteobacteria bacterium]